MEFPVNKLSLFLVTLEEVDEPVGGGVMGVHRIATLQFRLDHFGQLLAKLNPVKYTAFV